MFSQTAQKHLDGWGLQPPSTHPEWATLSFTMFNTYIKKPKWVFPVTSLQLKAIAYSQPTL